MYRKILLPLDGSRLSEGVVAYTAQIAAGVGAKITLLHVVTVQEATAGAPMVTGAPDDVHLPEGTYLKQVEENIRRYGAEVDSWIAAGVPSVEVVRGAEEKGYDLIAMATHGRSGVGRWVFGSTTDKVLHSSKLPMLLVRPGAPSADVPHADTLRSLVVPLDGSALAEMVLPTVESLAGKLKLPVTLMRVVPTAGMIYAGLEPYAYDPRIDEEFQKTAEDYLKKVAGGLRKKGITVTCEQRTGYAALHIIDFADAKKGSLVVMSTHGRSGVGRWIMGSVADRVLRATHRPILLFRSQKPEGQ